MFTDGSLFKKIRCSRNISQHDICKSTLSRTTLSKFENNKVMLSSKNFYYLLESVDISVEEFDYIKNGYSYNDKKYIIHCFDTIFSNSDIHYLNRLIVFTEKYLENNYSTSIKCILNVLYSLKYLESAPNEKIPCQSRIHIANVWSELSKIDQWTLLDIKIINSCLFFFDYSVCISLSAQLIENLKKYKNYSGINSLELSIYLNLTLLFLMHKDYFNAKKYSRISLKKAFDSKRLDYMAIASVRNGIAYKNQSDIKTGLTFLDILKDPNLKKNILKELNDFKMDYTNKIEV